MIHHPDEGQLIAHLDGALSEDEAARTQTHLEECETCRATSRRLRGRFDRLSQLLDQHEVVPETRPKRRPRIAAGIVLLALGAAAVPLAARIVSGLRTPDAGGAPTPAPVYGSVAFDRGEPAELDFLVDAPGRVVVVLEDSASRARIDLPIPMPGIVATSRGLEVENEVDGVHRVVLPRSAQGLVLRAGGSERVVVVPPGEDSVVYRLPSLELLRSPEG
ncbi:MAG: zf-HC2 domain-containing protein [Gemmatimonadota bacterium]